MNKYKSNEMIQIEEALDNALRCIYTSEKESDKEFFKSEYERIKRLYDEAVKNWIAIL